MNVGIIGTGYVGLTTAVALVEFGHSVICHDIDESKIIQLKNNILPFYEPGLIAYIKENTYSEHLCFTNDLKETVEKSDILMLCVGTPSLDDGSVNLNYIKGAASNILNHINSDKIVVIKSTVPVGTHKLIDNMMQNGKYQISIVNNPEFLREGSAVYDSFHPERIIIGTNNPLTQKTMLALYEEVHCRKICVDNPTAELIKYASNSFLAMKISYINLMAQICEKTNSNIKDIALGMGLDSRIGNKFLNAGMGYGGSCFAKDLSALIDLCIDNCINPNLLTAVQDINTNQIERLVDKIEEKLNPCINKTIGILGLSFKPNTDDLRDAPSIKLINKLLEKQFIIKAHDPIINGKIKNILPDIQLIKDESNQEENIYLLSENIDAIVIVTEWEIYKKIDWFKIKKLMKTPIIFDGRNILNGKEMESMGFEYYGVGN